MITLSAPTDKAVRAQIAESISLIASADFPQPWTDLIDVCTCYYLAKRRHSWGIAQKLVSFLSQTDYSVNIGVLQTAHSIFQPWRAATRSDSLYSVINYVLERFTKPFLNLFQITARSLLANAPGDATSTIQLRAQAMALMVDIFYDLTCQDLPPDMEDNHAAFFGPESGLFLQFLVWDPTELQGDVSPYDSVFVYACFSLFAALARRHYPVASIPNQDRDSRDC